MWCLSSRCRSLQLPWSSLESRRISSAAEVKHRSGNHLYLRLHRHRHLALFPSRMAIQATCNSTLVMPRHQVHLTLKARGSAALHFQHIMPGRVLVLVGLAVPGNGTDKAGEGQGGRCRILLGRGKGKGKQAGTMARRGSIRGQRRSPLSGYECDE